MPLTVEQNNKDNKKKRNAAAAPLPLQAIVAPEAELPEPEEYGKIYDPKNDPEAFDIRGNEPED
jgi:hypothetical protein